LIDQFGNYWEKGTSFSSGGFSEDWPMPAWQAEAVNWYLNNCPTVPKRTWFNASGRALPDISAFGDNVRIILGGDVTSIGGTSASSPIIAGHYSLCICHLCLWFLLFDIDYSFYRFDGIFLQV
jgi:tripeptidyl-peptidase-1